MKASNEKEIQMTDDINPCQEDGTPAVPLMAKRDPKADQSESVPLSACPFCGSRDIDGTGFAVECNSCGASTCLCASNEEATERWNTRMIPAPMHKTKAGIKDVQDFLYFEAFVASLRHRISQRDVPGSTVDDRNEVALAYATSVWPSRERKYVDACKCCDDAERRLKEVEEFATEMKQSTNSLVRACGHQMILRLQGEGAKDATK